MKHDTNERMMYCPDCNQHEYPVLMPAVIVALNDILRLYQIFFARRMTYESTDRLLRTDGWMSDARAHRRKQLFFVSGIERISAIILHIGLSLLIYRAVKAGECRTAESDKCRTVAFTAVLAYGIHFIVDFFAVAGSALLPIYVIEIGVFVMAAGTLVMALKMGRMEEL